MKHGNRSGSASKDERRATLKMHTGGEFIVKLVARLVEKYGISLPNVSIEDMLKDLDLAEVLQPLHDAADDYAQSIEDTILLARSECWSATTTFYTTLSRLADNDFAVAKDLEPIVAFFAKGPRPATPAPAPSPAPAPGSNGTNGSTTS
jgi:hypothetical protein